MNYCPECGRDIKEDWKKCPYCGFNLEELKRKRNEFHKTEQPYSDYDPNTPVEYIHRPTSSIQRTDTNTFGLISIIFAVIGLCICGIPFGILAFILGIIGVSKDRNAGASVVGIVLGLIDCFCVGIFLLGFSPYLF